MEGITVKAAMILPALILQKPFRTSKTKDHIKCMERGMKLWQEGNLLALKKEDLSNIDLAPDILNVIPILEVENSLNC